MANINDREFDGQYLGVLLSMVLQDVIVFIFQNAEERTIAERFDNLIEYVRGEIDGWWKRGSD